MLPSFCRDTVTRVRPGAKEIRGSSVPDWDNVQTKQIAGCSMQPATTLLSEDGRVMNIQDMYTLFAPPDADIRAGDRILFDNKSYTIDGDVRKQSSASGRLDHLNISLKRYQG